MINYPGDGLNAAQSALNALEEFNRRYAMIPDKSDWYRLVVETGAKSPFSSVRHGQDEMDIRATLKWVEDIFLTCEDDLFKVYLRELQVFTHRLIEQAFNIVYMRTQSQD